MERDEEKRMKEKKEKEDAGEEERNEIVEGKVVILIKRKTMISQKVT